MDALLNRDGRGSRLWLDRKPDTVSTKDVGEGILIRLAKGEGERERGRGVVLSKSTFKGLLLRVAAVSEVRRGSLSTTIFHNAMERRDAVGDDHDDDDDDDDDDGEKERRGV